MVGLVTPDEFIELQSRKESPTATATPQTPLSASVNKSSVITTTTTTTTGQYSRQSGRWNEIPKSADRSRSFRRRTPMYSTLPNHLFCVDEQEREMWVRINRLNFSKTFEDFFFLYLQKFLILLRCFKYFVKYYRLII